MKHEHAYKAPPTLVLAAPHLAVVCSTEVSRTEKPDPPPGWGLIPAQDCVTDRGCVFSSRPLELLCFLYPVTGQKLNPHRTPPPSARHASALFIRPFPPIQAPSETDAF